MSRKAIVKGNPGILVLPSFVSYFFIIIFNMLVSAFALAYLWGWVMRPLGERPACLGSIFLWIVWCVVDWIGQLVHMGSAIVYIKITMWRGMNQQFI